MDRRILKDEAKNMMAGNLGMLIVCTLVVSAIIAGVSCIPYVGSFATIFISGQLNFGLTCVYLGIYNGINPKVETVFSGFNRYSDTLTLYLLISVLTFVWSLLLIVPGIIKAIGWSQSWYILAENPHLTPKQAMDASEQAMDGHKMEYFMLQLSFIPWLLLVCVTCGIAAFYVGPYIEMTMVSFYYALKRNMVNRYSSQVEF